MCIVFCLYVLIKDHVPQVTFLCLDCDSAPAGHGGASPQGPEAI